MHSNHIIKNESFYFIKKTIQCENIFGFNYFSRRFPSKSGKLSSVTYISRIKILFVWKNNDKLESFLHQTIELRNVSDFLKAFGVKEDVDEGGIFGRKKDSYAEQATCQPELRTIELPSNEPDSLFFPVCVRLPRCGGCCGLSHVLECVPTKVSLRELKRARVRVKRSTNGRSSAEASQISIKVEIHDECKCKCKVKEDDCDDNLHRYKPQLCKCVCINQDKELACEKESSNKIWDGKSVRNLLIMELGSN